MSSSSPDQNDDDDATLQQRQRKEVAHGRWSILRDALLNKASTESNNRNSSSIHRFPGYRLLREFYNVDDSREALVKQRMEPLLARFTLDDSTQEQQQLEELHVAILALAACFPKGKCIKLTMPNVTNVDDDGDKQDTSQPTKFQNTKFFDKLKQRCLPAVLVWIVEQEQGDGITTTTLLVQEAKKATNYKVCLYDLEETRDADAANIQQRNPHQNHLFLWTREPRNQRLSLQDLVSHRTTKGGVDNTGNICVWDSERTLSYLMYHCFPEFVKVAEAMTKCTILPLNPILDSNHETPLPSIHILELGTGMAGLSALALGLRIAQNDQARQQSTCRSISITLTDGNEGGVLNNKVNQYLTKLYAQEDDEKNHPYHRLDVKCQTLLWTIDLANENESNIIPPANIVLISDCIHFQNFHAALACTVMRQLNVGGVAVFCQPTRGDSLDNFFRLLDTVDDCAKNPLMSRQWWSPSIVDDMHTQTHNDPKYKGMYDENLHRPKLLLVVKLREMTREDQQVLIVKHEAQYWRPRRSGAAGQEEGSGN